MTFRIFLFIIGELFSLKNTQLIITCRSFDLKFNQTLQVYLNVAKLVNINKLPEDEILRLFEKSNIKLPVQEKEGV